MEKNNIFSYCRDYGKVPVIRKIIADTYTPVLLLQKIASYANDYYLLESVKEHKWSRYSFLGLNPSGYIEINDGRLYYLTDNKRQEFDNPLEKLKEILAANNSPKLEGFPIFTGGAVGYFGYESAKYFDDAIKFEAKKISDLPDVKLMLIDTVIVFDHDEQYLYLISNIDSKKNFEEEYNRCQKVLDELEKLIKKPLRQEFKQPKRTLDFVSNMTKEKYIQNVEKAKEYIKKGDIFQVVPSQRFYTPYDDNLIDIYRCLRLINPSPYLYYIKTDGLEIAGCSPETLVRTVSGSVVTYPIAGTRKRGATEEEDDALEKDLLSDQKELAEHNMLVDLGRNDIGKIAAIGSVEVKNYLKIEKYSHVMHLTSEVWGKLRDDKTPLDALGAILPAGTLSGAPKIRAMQIIDELEGEKRGVYGGAIGYFAYNQNMDFCIAIRTLLKNDGILSVQAGGGVVLDSVGENEYQESVNKAKAVILSAKMACTLEGGEKK